MGDQFLKLFHSGGAMNQNSGPAGGRQNGGALQRPQLQGGPRRLTGLGNDQGTIGGQMNIPQVSQSQGDGSEQGPSGGGTSGGPGMWGNNGAWDAFRAGRAQGAPGPTGYGGQNGQAPNGYAWEGAQNQQPNAVWSNPRTGQSYNGVNIPGGTVNQMPPTSGTAPPSATGALPPQTPGAPTQLPAGSPPTMQPNNGWIPAPPQQNPVYPGNPQMVPGNQGYDASNPKYGEKSFAQTWGMNQQPMIRRQGNWGAAGQPNQGVPSQAQALGQQGGNVANQWGMNANPVQASQNQGAPQAGGYNPFERLQQSWMNRPRTIQDFTGGAQPAGQGGSPAPSQWQNTMWGNGRPEGYSGPPGQAYGGQGGSI